VILPVRRMSERRMTDRQGPVSCVPGKGGSLHSFSSTPIPQGWSACAGSTLQRPRQKSQRSEPRADLPHGPDATPHQGFIVVRTSAGVGSGGDGCRWPIREPEKCEGAVAVQGEQPVTMKICK
jgi:hypothetical protein